MMVGVHRGVQLRRRVRGPRLPGWNDEFETLATVLNFYSRFSTLLPLAAQRKAAEALLQQTEAVKLTSFEETQAGGVPSEWFFREDTDRDRVVLYLHGGGYSIGSIDTHRDLVSRLVGASQISALVPDYRLAPEHPFPAQLDDARATYHWLLEQGFAPERIIIAGDSAGGGLTLSTLLSLRDNDEPLPAGGVCLSPWTDLRATGNSMRGNRRHDYVHKRTLEAYAKRFVERHDLTNPLAAPLHADLHDLPPLLIQAGGAETLLDDAVRLCSQAREAGTEVELDIEPDMIHVWQAFARLTPKADQAVARIGAFVRERTGA